MVVVQRDLIDKTRFSMCIPEVIERITNDVDRVIIVGIEVSAIDCVLRMSF